MDPLTALSLAVNIIAIVDFSAKLVHSTWELSKTGAKLEHVEIQTQTTQAQSLLDRLKPGLNASTVGLSQDDKDLIELCNQSKTVSDQLLRVLNSCQSKYGSGNISFDTFWKVFKSMWHEDSITELQNRLEKIDSKAHRLVSIRYSESILAELGKLDRRFQTLGMSRAAEIEDVKQLIHDLASRGRSNTTDQHLMLTAADRGGRGKEFAVQAGILGQLRFEEIDRRFYELDQRKSHEKSYLWLEGSSTGAKKPGQSPTTFTTWLVSSENLYWISGVPGSGKSTLMKFLYSDPQTRTRLEDWAQGRTLLISAYFFWEVGKIALLRTQEGLLRTLLFQIMRQCPELISEIYADLWSLFTDALPVGHGTLSGFAGSQVSLEVSDLLGRVKSVCDGIARRNYCLFLLIDGLDEYDGKPREIIKLMETLTDLPNVKMCVASRPDNEFLQNYGGKTAKLYMEDFNTADITAYVHDSLRRHEYFRDLDERDDSGATLMNSIVSYSNGVFLWVRLVLEELEEGLVNREPVPKLQKTLDGLPKGLEEYFDHMLDKVRESDRADSASVLLVALHTHDLLPPLAYWYISEGPEELQKRPEVKATDFRENIRRRKDIDARLRNLSRGLLTIVDLPLSSNLNALQSSQLFGQKVNFLHRTVREFLVLGGVQRRLNDWKPDTFNKDEVICQALRSQIATSPTEIDYFMVGGPIASLVEIFTVHCRNMQKEPLYVSPTDELRTNLADILLAQRANGHCLDVPLVTHSTIAAAPTAAHQPSAAQSSASNADNTAQASHKDRVKKFFRRK